MDILDSITEPDDVRKLQPDHLPALAREIREFLIGAVCSAGGHLGSNLGVVELTIALHRVFRSPDTPILFDTGHQAYVHKILTGRRDDFARLRVAGGLSGYPNRRESAHDFIENSHASTSLSYADGLAKAFALAEPGRQVVAVIGDGALTGGMAWEALNNLGASRLPVVVVLNDNGRSYAPTAGHLPRHLDRLRDRQGYAAVVDLLGGRRISADDEAPAVAPPVEKNVFAALGLDYIGPVDGHDIPALERALEDAASRRRPVVVHCLTRKGLGYLPAETDEADRLHSVGVVDVATGRPAQRPQRTWTDAFADALLDVGGGSERIVAVTAAMILPNGLGPFADRFPERCFDVGIAEQHAVTSAAGLAMAGLHPVVALFATFAGRAFDQTLMDVGLHRLPVTFALNRAGITGPDGPSHHGVWDMAMLGLVPGMRIAAPRDDVTLAQELAEAVADSRGPTAVRFPKATVGAAIPAQGRWDGIDVLRGDPDDGDVLLVSVGALASACLDAADELADAGIRCTVVDPRWVVPVNPALVALAARHALVVTAEDGTRLAGVGARLAQTLADAGCAVPVQVLGLPNEYLPQGSRREMLRQYGLDGPGIARVARAAHSDFEPSRVRLVGGRR